MAGVPGISCDFLNQDGMNGVLPICSFLSSVYHPGYLGSTPMPASVAVIFAN